METGLGAYIRRRRETLGLSQTTLVERSGVSKSHLSQIEVGKIALPNAEIRRRLAAALGVSHVDLLVAAGELLPEEIAAAQVEGIVRQAPGSEAIHAFINQMEWTADPSRARHVLAVLRALLDEPPDPRPARPVVASPGHERT